MSSDYESIEVWSLALDWARRDEWSPPHIFAEGAAWGAGWMAAIIGMFEAIRKNYPLKHQWSRCWCGKKHVQPPETY